MKETVLFLVGCLLVVGALGVIAARLLGVSALAPKPATPFEYGDSKKAGKPAVAAEKPKRIAAIVKSSIPEPPTQQELPTAPEPDHSSPAAISTVAMPFPSPEEIGVGARDSSIKERFGSPTLSATTLDSGHRFEAFVYSQNRTGTVIRLQDGKVTSAYSVPDLATSQLLRNNH